VGYWPAEWNSTSRPGPTETGDSDMGTSRVQRVAEAFISVADVLDADVDALVPAGW